MSSHRLSVGMTPKTLRLPKHGEMLLSVHGSPLGLYKEDNMEAIHGKQYLWSPRGILTISSTSVIQPKIENGNEKSISFLFIH